MADFKATVSKKCKFKFAFFSFRYERYVRGTASMNWKVSLSLPAFYKVAIDKTVPNISLFVEKLQ